MSNDQRASADFMGTTLRGLLLSGYAFATIATIGTIAGIAARVAHASGAALVLVALGLWRARRVENPAERLDYGRVAQRA